MVDVEKKEVVRIREFDEERDVNVVGKLERECENNIIGTKKEVSIFTNSMGDPLSRIRFYPLHVMLVGVVRGCIKSVKTVSGSLLKMGSILGLRVSPTYRRKGVGLKLVRCVEEWMLKNGAEYSMVATEKNNNASTNLFTLKSNYLSLSSLLIFMHPIPTTTSSFPHTTKHIKIHKLNTPQAISFYTTTSKRTHFHLSDMDLILKDNLTLGTWLCYYKHHHNNSNNWIVFSLWNNTKSRHHHHHRGRREIKKKMSMFPTCLRARVGDHHALSRPIGFVFMYGLHGEGDSESLGELMESAWRFTTRVGGRLKDCKVVVTELGFDDPLAKIVPQTPSMSCIHDLWYVKRVNYNDNVDEIKDDDEVIMMMKGQAVRNVFVDPRDF
ncbi:putative N-acetyltransferase HLS1-like [Senna tora]|uniref:Putative N-acetyltransferase HLS1-like n=1 Tax=Senna tora TaxID=362788 RepID=A0A835CCQ3_9FABA|nr:putative N-acetyltransferase HLS1-like [Senna tora]